MNQRDVANSDSEWVASERRRFAAEPGHQFARLRLEYAAFRAIVSERFGDAVALEIESEVSRRLGASSSNAEHRQ